MTRLRVFCATGGFVIQFIGAALILATCKQGILVFHDLSDMAPIVVVQLGALSMSVFLGGSVITAVALRRG